MARWRVFNKITRLRYVPPSLYPYTPLSTHTHIYLLILVIGSLICIGIFHHYMYTYMTTFLGILKHKIISTYLYFIRVCSACEH